MKRMNSVTLDTNRCQGCTTCIKHCPTEAIRVRRGKATIIKERCIDCGQCIRVCPHHAKKAVCDPFESLENYEYKVALPAPSLYGQFRFLNNINIVLQGLVDIGFDDVYEVSSGAEMISDYSRRMMKQKAEDRVLPVISSACPAVVRLICMRFPKLVPNIVDLVAPVELSAILARERAVEKTGLRPEQIGIFFITPCPAKVTANKSPLVLEKPVIDGSLSMTDIYLRLLTPMKTIVDPPQLSRSGIIGIGWARIGGESSALLSDRHLAVDGIGNVIRILEDVENGALPEIEFLELNACTEGCVGGCLTVENPFISKSRIMRLMKYLPVSKNKVDERDVTRSRLFADKELECYPTMQLDEDRRVAIEKFNRIRELEKSLPGLDCSSCGAPSCRALAEDVVLGYASEEDCIFRMRERMQYLTGRGDADEYLPPPFRRTDERSSGSEDGI